MKERRDRKEMKADQQRHYEGLEELPVSRKAKERFRRPAYQARGMIREQGRQMERMSADKYLANKGDDRMDDNWNPEGYERLSAAVVEQAVTNYRRALRRLWRHPHDEAALHGKEECERFFRRDMGLYSDLDGEMIIKAIQERVNKEMGH